jgi:hypothetical protein
MVGWHVFGLVTVSAYLGLVRHRLSNLMRCRLPSDSGDGHAGALSLIMIGLAHGCLP